MKYNANTTMLLAVVQDTEHQQSEILPIMPLTIHNKPDGDVILKMDYKLDENRFDDDKKFIICIDYTDDPATTSAGDFIGLGYYDLRFQFKDCVVLNYNPLTVVCKKEHTHFLINRGMRYEYATMPQYDGVKLNMTGKYEVIDTFCPKTDITNVFPIITTIIKQETNTFISYKTWINPMSFFSKHIDNEHKEFKSANEVIDYHQKEVKKWYTPS